MRGRNNSGFALLLVFVMAAALAIALYMEMPRVAFESQRAKEELLVDRGNQYVTAIRRFYLKFNRFPAAIGDLENTNNMRFLRRRYVDPMTGKTDWRLIHVGPGGMLLDSLVQKPPAAGTPDGQAPAAADQNASANAGVPGAIVNSVIARRPSDNGPSASAYPGGATPPPADPNAIGGDPALQPMAGNPPYPALPVGNQPNPYQPGAPGQPPFPNQPYNPALPVISGQPFSFGGTGQMGGLGQPGQPQGAGVSPNGAPVGVPGFPGVPGGLNPIPVQIQQQIFGPRPAPSSLGMGGNNQVMGGGIAGVASKLERPGIKRIKDRKKYNEWEFVLDLSKMMGAGQQPIPQGAAPSPGGPGPTGPGANPMPRQ